ncbi:MAG: DUF4133 domain-containing protein [Rudanella sp.]|nr:DUF4133 domain-containing protein [Rudanella sp.]
MFSGGPTTNRVAGAIEFRGLRGLYFYYAAGGLITSVFATLLGYILGAPVLVAILLLFLGSGSTLLWCYTRNNRFGRWGAVKQKVHQLKPQFVCQYQSFNRLIPVRPTTPYKLR